MGPVALVRLAPVALGALVLAGCAGGTAAGRGTPDLSLYDLQARLAARASSLLGEAGEFRVGGARFAPDCTGFVEAVYEAEGIPLRTLMRRAAPGERTGVDAAWRAVSAYGSVLGRRDWPAPGDLVFWHDTYDRNRNRRTDDRFTHVGIVERVDGGTVHFIHRGGKGVARGVMTLARPHAAADGDRRPLNSTLRARSHPVRHGGLAAELFAGFARAIREPPEPLSSRP
jgi:hypothetical protein